ncbi:glycosyltransferase [Bradyrhizobium sp. 197]|uniref:glycosyltransferase n=1 Tax=Bradyrhizobium sp. 197 TaxID=2782663 RepID=UPI001FFB1D30|nr:glycosyltransferase [Bradyrhizobium sp. 197]MCK1473609.1 glycosyltransferase [Bradyrhizobium sp. 197]
MISANRGQLLPPAFHRVCFVIKHIGDYHASRLSRCQQELHLAGHELVAIEASRSSSFYAHRQRRAAAIKAGIRCIKLPEIASKRKRALALWRALKRLEPSHVFTIGYSDDLALISLLFAKVHRLPIFFMSDSKADDQERSTWSEWIKAGLLRLFDGALVAGARHRSYFRSLGMSGPIEIGYDVIDNAFFRARGAKLERRAPFLLRKGILPERYVICVSRLVGRKRVDVALRIYVASGAPQHGVRFMLIGAGPEEAAISETARQLGIGEMICHLRDVPNSIMPIFYRRSEALLLTSEYDQWGLCVNEAMALGIPCIVTSRCGVAGEIVKHGKSGFVVPPGEVEIAAGLLRQLLSDKSLRNAMSLSATNTIDQWDLPRFSAGVARLVEGRSGT